MASRVQRPTFANLDPHFFVVVQHDTLAQNQLLIPRKFVRQHGKTLSNSVFVKLPCGSAWKMDLEKSGNKVWLKEGWQEFSKHYSIGFGHFLVFRYRGNSRLDTYIFDKTAVEIDYPSIPSDENKDDNDSIDILEEFPPRAQKKSRTARANETNPRMSTRRNKKFSTESDSPVSVYSDTDFGPADGQNTKRKIRERNGSGGFEKHPKFSSKNPFFRNTITSNNIRHCSQPIPVKFGRTYFKQTKQSVRLELGRKSWSSDISYYGSNCDLYVLTGGWSRFLKDNGLSPGDVCVYELIHPSPAVFKVTIFRCRA